MKFVRNPNQIYTIMDFEEGEEIESAYYPDKPSHNLGNKDIELVEYAEVKYAEWYYDPDGMDWGLGAWKCSKCHTKNDNLGGSENINPYMFSGSKFCPQCGAVMKPKESDK